MEQILWYKAQAQDFDHALPVGNGRIGGMVFGGASKEIIKLNEDSLYSGGPRSRINPRAYEGFQEIRSLLLEEKIAEAESLAFQKMQGVSPNARHYMPLGELTIYMGYTGKAREYQRSLDLERAVAEVCFHDDAGTRYKRSVYVSYPAQVMVIAIESDTEGAVDFSVNLDGRDDYYDDNRPMDERTILYTGGTGSRDGIFFATAMTAFSEGGTIETIGNALQINKAKSALILLSCETSFYHGDRYEEMAIARIQAIRDRGLETPELAKMLLLEHIEDYQSLYKRVDFTLNDNTGGESAKLSTSARIERLRGNDLDNKECSGHIHDNGLAVLYYQYARYLTIAGSRQGTQPMNLQGIWNQDMWPAWGCRFTININTQMNYWCTESANLSECHLPLFDLLTRMRPNGERVAKEMYHCRGFCCHHNTDIWGDCAPQDLWMPATIWPMGAAWLCLHIYMHYEYTLDEDFLAEHFDTLCEAARFFVDYLFPDAKGRLVTGPSTSPENTYLTEGGEKGSLCIGPSMDTQIITVLFQNVIAAAKVLGRGEELALQLQSILPQLPPIKIGKYGQIMEWAEDYDEVEIGHRHISQLFALHPADLISPHKTPQLATAARATLIRRLIHGGGHTGWSRAWIMNMWARLGDANMVYENLQKLLAHSTNPNLLDSHPPFQIDGNFGGAAGITECLLQSHSGEIQLLPALPEEWQSGTIRGLRAKGGFEVSLAWEKGKLTNAEILSHKGMPCVLRYGEGVISVQADDGSSVNAQLQNGTICFATTVGQVYRIRG